MANNTTMNPFYFDSSTSATATGPMRIKSILWTGIAATNDIAAGDEFKITDTAGRVLANKIAVAAGDDLYLYFGDKGARVTGINVATLVGGICIVYLVDDDHDSTFVS